MPSHKPRPIQSVSLFLGMQGRSVLVIDKLKEHKEIFKGELLHPGSLERLEKTPALKKLQSFGACTVNELVSATATGRTLCAMDYGLLPTFHNECWTLSYQQILASLMNSLPTNVDVCRGGIVRHYHSSDGRACGVHLEIDGSGYDVQASLVVAADGVSSKLRSQAGIKPTARVYDHQVIAFDLTNVPVLGHRATTYITTRGMRVAYPMPRNGGRLYIQISRGFIRRLGRANLGGWLSQVFKECPGLEPISDATFRALPRARVLSARRFLVEQYCQRGMALVGDAARSLHPMTGQGMNAGIADAWDLARLSDGVDLSDSQSLDRALSRYSVRRLNSVRPVTEFSHRFAELFTQTCSRIGYYKTKYILLCHGRNERLCYKIMRNLSGIEGYESFSLLDRLQQLGFPDRDRGKIPNPILLSTNLG